MRTQIALVAFTIALTVVLGVCVSGLANAQQSADRPFALLSASEAAYGPVHVMTVRSGGHGGRHGGRAFFRGGIHHGVNHFRGHGFYGSYGPYYYSSGPYYDDSDVYGDTTCVFDGYQYVCYDTSDDY